MLIDGGVYSKKSRGVECQECAWLCRGTAISSSANPRRRTTMSSLKIETGLPPKE